MDFSGKRAVAASVQAEPVRRLLLDAGYDEVLCAPDGVSALRMVRQWLPELVVADAVLPGIDGRSLIRRIGEMHLSVRPSVILTAPPGFNAGNADCDCIVLEKPLNGESFRRALEILESKCGAIPETKRLRAAEILSQLGVPSHYGREYLLSAIGMVWADVRLTGALTTKLYPMVAEAFGVNVRHVERAMSYVIEEAWKHGEIEMQYSLFKNTIDARRGCPTCGEMIAQIADILRWEGNA